MNHVIYNNELFLSAAFKINHPHITLSDTATLISINHYDNNINLLSVSPFCVICNNHKVEFRSADSRFHYISLYYCKKGKHIYCDPCYKNVIKQHFKTCIIEEDIIIYKDILRTKAESPFYILDKLMYKCKWPNCNKIYTSDNLVEHQNSCEIQPRIQCPINGCSWIGLRSDMARYHFKKLHSLDKCKVIFDNKVLKPQSGTTYYFSFADVLIEVKYSKRQMGDVYEHSIYPKNCNNNLKWKPLVMVATSVGNNLECQGVLNGVGVVVACESEQDIQITVVCQTRNETF